MSLALARAFVMCGGADTAVAIRAKTNQAHGQIEFNIAIATGLVALPSIPASEDLLVARSGREAVVLL